MHTYKVRPCESIYTTANNMIEIADETKNTVVAIFNEIEIKAEPRDNLQTRISNIVGTYERKHKFLTATIIKGGK